MDHDIEEVATVRDNLNLEVAYSLNYEKMMYKFFGRVDKLCAYLTLIFGVSAISSLIGPVVLGIVIALISAFQLIYSPSSKYYSSKSAYIAYNTLFKEMVDLSDEELRGRLNSLCEIDTDEIGLLAWPAHIAGMIKIGYSKEQIDSERKMTACEKLFALLVGEYPHH